MTENKKKHSNPLVRLIRGVWSAIKIYFFMIGLLVTVVSFTLISAVIHLTDTHPQRAKSVTMKDDKRYIVRLVLDGELREKSPEAEEVFLSRLLRQSIGIDLLSLQTDLRRAAEDQRVAGLFIEIRNLSGSLAAFSELRAQLAKFREAKKTIHVWLATADTTSYYLASVADHLSLAPAGDLTLLGPVINLTYFAEGLKKLGANMQVIRSGKFKAAYEPFVRNEPSAETLLMYRELEQSLRQHLAQSIAQNRPQGSPETVEAWMRKSLFTLEEAKSVGIIDETLSLSDAEAKAQGTGDQAREMINLRKYQANTRPLFALPKPEANSSGLALIEAVGNITLDGDSSDDQVITPSAIAKPLKWARENEQVKAVVIRVSSPGGSAVASDLIWQKISELAKVKPVVISMGAYAASGGYYIAAAGHKIVAEPTTITGSIGVIAMVPEFSKFREKYGVSFYAITNSERLGLVNPGTPVSEADRTLLIAGIDNFYQTFLSRVAAGRNMKIEQVDQIAQGRVWTGQQALAVGLVDEMGGLREAFHQAKILAKLDPEQQYPILRYSPEQGNVLECIMDPANFDECMDAGAAVISRSTRILLRHYFPAGPGLERLERFLIKARREPMQALWPGALYSTPLAK